MRPIISLSYHHCETDPESSDTNLQYCTRAVRALSPTRVWTPFHAAVSLALGRWNTGYTRKRPRGQGVGAVFYKNSVVVFKASSPLTLLTR